MINYKVLASPEYNQHNTIEEGVEVDCVAPVVQIPEGMTVFDAARQGLLDVLRVFYEAGDTELDPCESYRASPLMLAAENGHLGVVKFLVEVCKVNVDLTLMRTTALMFAAEKGHLEVVKFLFRAGSLDINYWSSDFMSALMLASKNGHLNVVKFLVEVGKADINDWINSKTAVMHAAENGHLNVVKYLVEDCEADISQKGRTHDTTLIVCAQRGHADVVEFLCEVDKSAIHQKLYSGKSAWSAASWRGHIDAMKALLKYSAKMKIKLDFSRPRPIDETNFLKKDPVRMKYMAMFQPENSTAIKEAFAGPEKPENKEIIAHFEKILYDSPIQKAIEQNELEALAYLLAHNSRKGLLECVSRVENDLSRAVLKGWSHSTKNPILEELITWFLPKKTAHTHFTIRETALSVLLSFQRLSRLSDIESEGGRDDCVQEAVAKTSCSAEIDHDEEKVENSDELIHQVGHMLYSGFFAFLDLLLTREGHHSNEREQQVSEGGGSGSEKGPVAVLPSPSSTDEPKPYLHIPGDIVAFHILRFLFNGLPAQKTPTPPE